MAKVPVISNASAVVGLIVFGSLMYGLPRFVVAPLWMIAGGAVLNAAFYVAIMELVLSRIRQRAMTQLEGESPYGPLPVEKSVDTGRRSRGHGPQPWNGDASYRDLVYSVLYLRPCGRL